MIAPEVDVIRCACGNRVAPGVVSCVWCEGHLSCVVPAGVCVVLTQWTGGPVARCQGCGFMCGYWDCVCELSHDCEPV
jgi:hypothetical protein